MEHILVLLFLHLEIIWNTCIFFHRSVVLFHPGTDWPLTDLKRIPTVQDLVLVNSWKLTPCLSTNLRTTLHGKTIAIAISLSCNQWFGRCNKSFQAMNVHVKYGISACMVNQSQVHSVAAMNSLILGHQFRREIDGNWWKLSFRVSLVWFSNTQALSSRNMRSGFAHGPEVNLLQVNGWSRDAL